VELCVPCNRPADAFAALDPEIESPVTAAEISALLRSWEERFDAVLIELDELACTFSVGAPPTTPEQALGLAAEFQVVMPTLRLAAPRRSSQRRAHAPARDPSRS
jgi:hypothetical protein